MTANRYDVVVIGGGHNGLVAAAYLARAGLRVVVLEARERVGGAADTAEIAPRVRAPVVTHTLGVRSSIVRDLELTRHGLAVLRPPIRTFAPQSDGPGIALWADPKRTVDGLRQRWPGDAAEYVAFDQRVRSLASFVAYLNATVPPDIKTPSFGDAVGGLRLARAFKRLGTRAGRELLRVLPMAVADLVGEAFEAEPIRGVLAARGIRYTAMGPWSAGTAAVFLSDSATANAGAAGPLLFAQGGPGRLSDALAAAARAAGAEIRTQARVAAILSDGDTATGVAVESGEELSARAVVSAVDPKRTIRLCDPVAVGPTLRWRGENIRTPGTVAKVNLVIDGLPSFGGASPEMLRGRITIGGSVDDLERAFDASKYGTFSERPYLDVTIPTLSDPSLTPQGTHVLSVLMQFAPYELRGKSWDDERERLADVVLARLEEHAPGLTDRVTHRHVLTPLDLERDYGLTGGHPLHAEPGLDQFFAWRPLLGHANHRFVLRGLYLAGAGAHPGGGVTGAPGQNAAKVVAADLRSRR